MGMGQRTCILILSVIFSRSRAQQETPLSLADTDLEGSSLRFSGRYFRDRLELDRDQMTRFREFNFSFRQNAREINLNLGYATTTPGTECRLAMAAVKATARQLREEEVWPMARAGA